MELADYTLKIGSAELSRILNESKWDVPMSATVLLANCFCDLFLEFKDQKVYMLDIGGGSLERVADTPAEFYQRLVQAEIANNWLMIPLVDELRNASVCLDYDQCYGYLQLPIFEGKYDVENTMVVPISEYLELTASIHDQIKNHPDGTRVIIKVED